MRTLLVAALFAFATLTAAQSGIRKIDFKNFTYPRTGPLLGHSRLRWLATNVKGKVTLHNGSDGEGFSFQSVTYASVTGGKEEDAIVVLHYDTGGTQQTDYIYIVRETKQGPKVAAYCYTGDRAYSGLYAVDANHGALIVELFDPDKSEGDCCSSGIIRTRYVWRHGGFERQGSPVHAGIKSPQ